MTVVGLLGLLVAPGPLPSAFDQDRPQALLPDRSQPRPSRTVAAPADDGSKDERTRILSDYEAMADKPSFTPWQVAVSEALRDGDAGQAIEAWRENRLRRPRPHRRHAIPPSAAGFMRVERKQRGSSG